MNGHTQFGSGDGAPVTPIDTFLRQEQYPRLYWHARGSDQIVVAAGATQVAHALEAAQSLSDTLPIDAWLYGGSRFDTVRLVDPEWRPFGACFFFLPALEWRFGPEGCQFIKRGNPIALHHESPTARGSGTYPGLEAWTQTVGSILSELESGVVGKVVPARCRVDSVTGGTAGLLNLIAGRTEERFCFLLEIAPGVAFASVSPERLFRLEDGRLYTEALAGTVARGEDPQEDAILRARLYNEKDRREHRWVSDFLVEQLEALGTTDIQRSATGDMALTNGRHLYETFEAAISTEVTVLQVLRSLHPTPAVCGYPKQEAADLLRELEPFDRGWYAGPVGRWGRDSAEFAVAIRSGLLAEAHLHRYAGAGIVTGSDAILEWQEVEAKTADLLMQPREHVAG